MDSMSYDPIAETVRENSPNLCKEVSFSLFYFLIDFERLDMIVLSASPGGYVLLKSSFFFIYLPVLDL